MRIGVDAHVITGKFQGSRTYLLNVLIHLGRIDQTNAYIIYSFDPEITCALLPYANFTHRRIGLRPAIPRLLFYWPWQQFAEKLDFLLTAYFSPLLYPQRQLLIVYDVLFASHPQYFGRLAGIRLRTLVPLCARRARRVIAISETMRQEIMARYRIPASRMALVPGGITPAPAAAAPCAGPYVLAVGRLEPRKNIMLLLRAFRLMRTPNIRLVVIGREDFGAAATAQALRHLQEDPEFAGRVDWLQNVPDSDLPNYYKNAAVFAFPSFAEGFGLPVLEALAQATPVVANGDPALREVGGAFARYFDANAADAAAAMAALLDQSVAEGLAAPGLAGPVAACGAHIGAWSWERSAKAMLDVIKQVG